MEAPPIQDHGKCHVDKCNDGKYNGGKCNDGTAEHRSRVLVLLLDIGETRAGDEMGCEDICLLNFTNLQLQYFSSQ